MSFTFQKRIELEKQLAKFEREVSTAKKSKCEQNLFCVINLDLIAAIGILSSTGNIGREMLQLDICNFILHLAVLRHILLL